MDSSTTEWLSEMGMEDLSLLYQCQMDFLDDPIPQFTPNIAFQTLNPKPPSSFCPTWSLSGPADLDSYTTQTATEKPIIQQITKHWNSNINQKISPKSSSSPFSSIISFGNHSNPEQEFPKKFHGNIINSSVMSKEEPVSPTKANFQYDYGSVEFDMDTRRVNTLRSPLQAKDHVIAERKRREKLNESFIALSALLPGLTKLDKASILGEAIQHIKELQENAKVLEAETIRGKADIFRVIKPCSSGDDDTSSSVDNFDYSCFSKPNVEVEVRICENEALIRILCDKENGVMGKIFRQVEKYNMIIINSNAMPFDHTSLAISIVAQIEGQISTSAKDLAINLRSALRN